MDSDSGIEEHLCFVRYVRVTVSGLNDKSSNGPLRRIIMTIKPSITRRKTVSKCVLSQVLE